MGQPSSEHVMTGLELPEDPDYSLKKSFDASVNEAVNVAKMLLTAPDEVRKLILNECDMVLQCKVCKNFFSSVDNFLTHKRIYCQEEFADRTLLHRKQQHSLHHH